MTSYFFIGDEDFLIVGELGSKGITLGLAGITLGLAGSVTAVIFFGFLAGTTLVE